MERAELEGTNELVWLDRSGRLSSVIATAQPGLSSPAVSPDGKWLASTVITDGARDIWVHDLTRGTEARLTFTDWSEVRPTWFPDSKRLLYGEVDGVVARLAVRSADGLGTKADLEVDVGVDRRGMQNVNMGIGLWDGLSQVSPDGQQLLFVVDESGPLRLRLVELSILGGDRAITTGTPKRFIAEDPEPDVIDARISPDGKLVAYVTTESGQAELYLTRFPSGTGRWQVSPSGGRLPRWAADTGELFFSAGTGPATRVLSSVKIETEPNVAVHAPETLFEIDSGTTSVGSVGYDVSPDGSKFALVRRASDGGPPPRMILVLNWFKEFEGR